LKNSCDGQTHPIIKFMQLREALGGVRETLILAAGTEVDLAADKFHQFMVCAFI
jgi:hypothetical protein